MPAAEAASLRKDSVSRPSSVIVVAPLEISRVMPAITVAPASPSGSTVTSLRRTRTCVALPSREVSTGSMAAQPRDSVPCWMMTA